MGLFDGWFPTAKRGTVLGDVTGSVGDGINDVVNTAAPAVANAGGMLHHSLETFAELARGNIKGAGQEAGQFFNSGKKILGITGDEPQPIDEQAAPNRPDVTETTLAQERNDNLRRRSSRTNLTGGMGITDSPRTASTTLMGN